MIPFINITYKIELFKVFFTLNKNDELHKTFYEKSI